MNEHSAAAQGLGIAMALFMLAIPIIFFLILYKIINKPVQFPSGNLSDSERTMYYDSMKRKSGVAFALWFFFGSIGMHRVYLGQAKTGIYMFALYMASVILTLVVVGLFGFIALGIWWFIDLFLISKMTEEYNNNLIAKLSGKGNDNLAFQAAAA